MAIVFGPCAVTIKGVGFPNRGTITVASKSVVGAGEVDGRTRHGEGLLSAASLT
jgi:hypothetical protein